MAEKLIFCPVFSLQIHEDTSTFLRPAWLRAVWHRRNCDGLSWDGAILSWGGFVVTPAVDCQCLNDCVGNAIIFGWSLG